MGKQQKPASQSKKDAAIAQSVAKYIEEQAKASKNLKKSIDEVADDYSDLAKVLQGLVRDVRLFGDEWEDIEDISKTMLKNIENIGTEYYEQVKTAKQFKQIQEKQAKLDKDKKDSQDKIKEALEDEKKEREKLKDLADDYNVAILSGSEDLVEQSKKALEIQQSFVDELHGMVQDYVKIEEAKISETEQAEKNLNYAKEHLIALQEQLNVLDRAHKVAEEMGISIHEISDEIMAPFEKAMSFIDNIPGGGMMKKFFGIDKKMEGIQKKVMSSFTKGLAETGSVGKSAFTALGVGAKGFMVSLGPILPILIAVAATAALLKAAFDLDAETTDMARNLGVSKDEALELHHHMIEVQKDSDNVLMTVENQTAAMQELVTVTGGLNSISEDMVANQVLLTKNLGVSSDAASKLNVMFKAQGQNLEDNSATVAATVEMYNKATGANVSTKEVFEDIASVSKNIQLQFKGNIKALTLQVLKAKQLGLTLDQIADIGRQSLDIESSVASEMEARVLTGKQINLNAFREASLHNDTAKMMEEIQKNAGSSAEFASMNVLQQEAMAKAFGMQKKDFAEMLEKQELFAALGNKTLEQATEEEILNSNMDKTKKDALIAQKQQASQAEKLNKLTEGLKNTLASVGSMLMPILDAFSELAQDILPVLVPLMKIMFTPLMWALKVAVAILKPFTSLISMIGGLSDEAPKAAAGAETKMNDGAFSPVGPSGYSRVLSGPKGSVALNDQDTVVTGTNLNQGNGAGSNAEMIGLLRQLIAKIDQPVQIHMGGKVIDEIGKQTTLKRTYTTNVDRGYGAFG